MRPYQPPAPPGAALEALAVVLAPPDANRQPGEPPPEHVTPDAVIPPGVVYFRFGRVVTMVHIADETWEFR